MTEIPAAAEREVHSPSSLARLVRELLEGQFPRVWIEGELSNFSRPASGHLYFTLKDAGAQLRCAMFRPQSTWLRFRLVDGQQVLARGRVSLYAARGDFQLIVDHLEEAGEGALRRAFEELRARLEAEGLFAQALKRPIPAMPRRIGILTSASGAALHDVLSVLARRCPLLEVEVLPVPVQGREAPPAIIAMLAAASRAGRHDVLLLTRGGGSLEDLQAFNDEALARAIRASSVPVVAAIGHEVDLSIAELVADLRAPTPSAAAELLAPDMRELARRLADLHARTTLRLRRSLENRAQHLDHLLARLSTQRPQARLARAAERMATLDQRLRLQARLGLERHSARLAKLHSRLRAGGPSTRMEARGAALDLLHARLERAARGVIERRSTRLQVAARALHAVSPLATLERGYALLFERDSGALLRSAEDARPGLALRARLADGELALRVELG